LYFSNPQSLRHPASASTSRETSQSRPQKVKRELAERTYWTPAVTTAGSSISIQAVLLQEPSVELVRPFFVAMALLRIPWIPPPLPRHFSVPATSLPPSTPNLKPSRTPPRSRLTPSRTGSPLAPNTLSTSLADHIVRSRGMAHLPLRPARTILRPSRLPHEYHRRDCSNFEGKRKGWHSGDCRVRLELAKGKRRTR
jgi:hypothetical protein